MDPIKNDAPQIDSNTQIKKKCNSIPYVSMTRDSFIFHRTVSV